MDTKSIVKWSKYFGMLGVLSFILAVVVFYSNFMIAGLDHKDFYFGGVGLLALAIWLKLGAIYRK